MPPKRRLSYPNYETNYDIADVAEAIVALMPNAPLATDYTSGTDIFPTVFRYRAGGVSCLVRVCQGRPDPNWAISTCAGRRHSR